MKKFLERILKYYSPPYYVVPKSKMENGVDGRIVVHSDRNSNVSEQYKILRTNLYSLSPDKPFKSIVITSSQGLEGKTVTSTNLAYTLSLDTEKKIILIDADLRKPMVHRLFGIPRKPGFSRVLNNELDIKNFLKKPAIGNLYIIPSGKIISAPSEILGSAKIEEVIDYLKTRFDYIIFDTPPVGSVADASILGAKCDAVILVVKAGSTQKDTIEETFTMLRNAHVNPKACILTNVTIPAYYYYFGNYRYRYRYESGHGTKNGKNEKTPKTL